MHIILLNRKVDFKLLKKLFLNNPGSKRKDYVLSNEEFTNFKEIFTGFKIKCKDS